MEDCRDDAEDEEDLLPVLSRARVSGSRLVFMMIWLRLFFSFESGIGGNVVVQLLENVSYTYANYDSVEIQILQG